jgi:hypothetical protein
VTNDSTGGISFGVMRDAIDLLHQYAIHFPELPQAFITMHRRSVRPSLMFPTINLQVDVQHFEPWREALNMDPYKTHLEAVSGGVFLETTQNVTVDLADRTITVSVHLYAPGIQHRGDLLPPRQVEDPHDSALHHNYALGRDLPEVRS